jgi:hypothetical protein
MNTRKLLSGIGLIVLMVVFGRNANASPTVKNAHLSNLGYTEASFVVDVDSASADSITDNIIIYYGTSIASMSKLDSVTGGATITYPDTVAEAVGTFRNGTTYYWYVAVVDTTGTTYWPPDYKSAPFTFTTTDFEQNLTVTAGYSTAQVIHDSVGYYVAPLDSIVLLYGKTSGSLAAYDTITSVTHPDTFAVTGLDEGVTYYFAMIAYLADSSIVDTSAEFSGTTTNLQSSVSVLRAQIDSLVIIIDSVDFCPDSLILQWGAGLRGITANADTNTSPNCPDTVAMTGIIEGSTISYRVLYFLPDSSAIDTGTVATYTRPHNKFIENTGFQWPSNTIHFTWDFSTSGDDFSTGPLPIHSKYLRIHAAIDGEDDAATYDSIEVFIWSWDFGDSTVIDTIIALDVDTVTITPLKYLMYPAELTDSSMTYYPEWDWGTHFSISATMTDSSTASFADSVLGIRSVSLVIEEIE